MLLMIDAPNRDIDVRLSYALRAEEEDVLHGVSGNIFDLQALCRLIARRLASGSLVVRYDDLPPRLRQRVSGKQHNVIAKRLGALAGYERLHARLPAMEYEPEQVPMDRTESERMRRVEVYAKRFSIILEQCGESVDDRPKRPDGRKLCRPVYCELGGREHRFTTLRKAVRFMAGSGFTVDRRGIRRAARHNGVAGGARWWWADRKPGQMLLWDLSAPLEQEVAA